MNVSLEKARAEYNNNNDRNDIADAMENQISLLVVYSVFLLLLLPADSKDFWDAALLPILSQLQSALLYCHYFILTGRRRKGRRNTFGGRRGVKLMKNLCIRPLNPMLNGCGSNVIRSYHTQVSTGYSFGWVYYYCTQTGLSLISNAGHNCL